MVGSLSAAFDELKSKFVKPPILTFANFDLPFILDVDASLSGLGAVLSQVQGGEERRGEGDSLCQL